MSAASGGAPDVVLVGGPVVTMDPARPRADGLALREGRIAAVGSADEIAALGSECARVVELDGACALPGLIEPHTHPDLCAQCYAWVDVSGFTHAEVGGVEAALRDAVARTPRGEWIFAFGLDAMLTADIGTWGRDRLDAISADHPIAVMIQSMHTVFVNSAAFRAAGIDESSPDPPGGGRYQKDADGRLTGKLEEATAALPFLRFDVPTEETLRERMWQQYRRYSAAGLTTIGIPGLFTPPSMLGLFEEFSERGDVPIRAIAYLRHHHVGEVKWRPGDGTDLFRVQGVKLWYDGSPYSGTMLLDEPYLESRLCCCTLGIRPGTTGHANFSPAELSALTADLLRDGWQVLTHAQGDRGTREILDLYETALTGSEASDHRWRLEHCALIAPDQLERARALGVSPSFHMNHLHYYGTELRDRILGPERTAGLMPAGTALRAGLRISLHADSPMFPPEPFRLMQTAVTRRTRLGDEIGGTEALSAEEALRAITLDAAWQLFADEQTGSLEVGKLADLTIVDRDPLEIDSATLAETRVLGTWVSGRDVGA